MSDAALEVAGVKDETDLTTESFGIWRAAIGDLAGDIEAGSRLDQAFQRFIANVSTALNPGFRSAGFAPGPGPDGTGLPPGPEPDVVFPGGFSRGGGTVTITVPVSIDGRQVAEAVAEANLSAGGEIQ